MSATKRFESLYRKENAKYWVRAIFFVILPILLVVAYITQNVPIKQISTQSAVVTYVNSTTTSAETSSGGHPISRVIVELANGHKTSLNVLIAPVPRVGDEVLVRLYKNRFSGVSYLYGGIKSE